jgi:hypothetical protein
VRTYFVYALLLLIKLLSRFFYRIEMRWIGGEAPDAWENIRLVALLNHTSLFEPIFAGGPPNSFLWRIARHGVVPAADKTICRPVVGRLFRFVAHHVVSITRERDHTWAAVLARIEPESMVIILPEGRMKRPNGLDANGQPMTVRGGIADIIAAMREGKMLLAYSGGLHHVQAPGEHVPRIFRRVRMNLENVEISDYIRQIAAETDDDFKRSVKEDLARRRDANCPA